MRIKSTYREKNNNFTLKVISEEKDYYLVQLEKEWQNEFQEGDKITKLEKRLIGKLYEIEKDYQPTLFELL